MIINIMAHIGLIFSSLNIIVTTISKEVIRLQKGINIKTLSMDYHFQLATCISIRQNLKLQYC